MAVVIDIYDENESKWQKFKRKLKDKYESAKGWVVLHEQDLMFYIPIGLAAAAGLYKIGAKQHRLNTERKLKDLYIYDRSMGRYVELRRKLNQRDLLTISQRRKMGERLTDILIDLKLVR